MRFTDIKTVEATRCRFKLEQLVRIGFRVLDVGNDEFGALFVLGHLKPKSEISKAMEAARLRATRERIKTMAFPRLCRALFRRQAESIRARSSRWLRPCLSCLRRA